MNGKCFMAAAIVGHAKLLNKLKENFCQENTEVGYQWFRQTCHKVGCLEFFQCKIVFHRDELHCIILVEGIIAFA